MGPLEHLSATSPPNLHSSSQQACLGLRCALLAEASNTVDRMMIRGRPPRLEWSPRRPRPPRRQPSAPDPTRAGRSWARAHTRRRALAGHSRRPQGPSPQHSQRPSRAIAGALLRSTRLKLRTTRAVVVWSALPRSTKSLNRSDRRTASSLLCAVWSPGRSSPPVQPQVRRRSRRRCPIPDANTRRAPHSRSTTRSTMACIRALRPRSRNCMCTGRSAAASP